MPRSALLLAVVFSLAVAACKRAPVDESAKSPGEEIEPISMTLFTEKVELFMEHPRLIVNQPARFLAHLTRLADGEPVTQAKLTIEAVLPTGERIDASVIAPKRDALYTPEMHFVKPGVYKATLRFEGPMVSDSLVLPELVVHADEAAARRAAEAESGTEPPDAVLFLLEQQWKIKMTLAVAAPRTMAQRLLVGGEVRLPPGTEAVVAASIAGRLTGGEGVPMPGDRVTAGQVLGSIEPPLRDHAAYFADRAQVRSLALEVGLRRFDLDTKRLEAEQALVRAGVQVEFATRAHTRLRDMRPRGLATEDEVLKADESQRLAEADAANATKALSALEDAGRRLGEIELQVSVPTDDGKNPAAAVTLAAPIDGAIVAKEKSPGEHVDAGEVVFRIANLERVWIEARVPEFDLARLPENPAASIAAPVPGSPRFDIAALGGRFVGRAHAVDAATRTLAFRYEIPNADRRLPAGMTVDVAIVTNRSIDAVAVPAECIVMDNGRPSAFVLIEGETFQRRALETGIRDDEFVEVKRGIVAGERVAARGAYAIKLSSLTPAQFGHGHAH